MYSLKVFILMMLLLLAACTKEPEKKIDIMDFQKDTRLMVEICSKFANEQDAKRLHKVAVATETTKMFKCFGYSDLCVSYGECLSTVIKASADGQLSGSEKIDIQKRLTELQSDIRKFEQKHFKNQ